MKAHMQMKTRGFAKVSAQQVIYELKHKVVLALNKLADRDTYQIAVDDLEKTIECLTPDGIAPFLSCILDTDSEQKSAVRKECIRLIGVLVRFHEGLVGSHLPKMVSSVVKRLKDPDSVVRDSCVETMGVLALKLSKRDDDGDGIFVVLVKPLFEALGEQNKQVQAGSALCLARVIDQTCDPPVAILQKMLTRTIKLLKSPHFKAKPAVLELNRSIILAGGAPSQSVLSAAMASIQEALKNSDWTTRKAASMALGEIASSGGSFLTLFKASCIRSLESCRFDKVKPVRDVVLHALHYWKSLPGSDTSEPSETGSYMKENFCGGDYSDITSTTDSGRKNITFNKITKDSANKRSIPLSLRKAGQNYTESSQISKSDDWQIEIAVPKTHNDDLVHLQNEDSEDSSVTKTMDMSTDVISVQDTGFDYVTMDEKQECSSVSNLVTDKVADNFHTKFMTLSCDNGLHEPLSRNSRFATEEIHHEEQLYNAKMQDRRSLDSTVTESSCQAVLPMHGSCCSQVGNEMVFIRKQLLDVQNKQSNLMDLMQVFSTTVMDSLSALQSKVLGLEQVVEKITQDVEHGGRYPDFVTSKITAQRSSISSPRLSTCSPRPSVDICNRQTSLLSVRKSEEEKSFTRSRLSGSSIQNSEMWTNSTEKKIARNFAVKDIPKNSGQESQIRKNNGIFTYADARQNNVAKTNGIRQRVKSFLCEGDLDSAYVEALCCDDERVLFELLNRTGPVLESLSHKTSIDVLSTLGSYVSEQRYMNYIVPWLQQVVELSAIHGPNRLGLSVKTKREFLFAIQEAAEKEFSNPAERRAVTQLAMRLRQVWGICP